MVNIIPNNFCGFLRKALFLLIEIGDKVLVTLLLRDFSFFLLFPIFIFFNTQKRLVVFDYFSCLR